MYSSRYGAYRHVSDDSASEYSIYTVTTTTTTRERINRNHGALELETMMERLQEACGGVAAGPGFIWRMRAETTLSVLMHWMYEAKMSLEPFLKYHSTYPATQGQPGLPVPGYVNLVNAAWILQVVGQPGRLGAIGAELGNEGKTVIRLLTCVCLSCFLL